MTQKTNVCVLASTSAGNCTAIWNNRISLLVDCGTTVSYTESALAVLGLSLKKLSGVFITHSHGDHVNQFTINRLVEHNIPVITHEKIAKVLKKKFPHLHDKKSAMHPFTKGTIACDGFSFVPFPVPHDSNGGCFGYSFFMEHKDGPGGHKITIATDLGSAGPELVAHFADSDIIVIESNHDVTMLKESPRPQWLKDRIIQTGHLSNDECGAFINRVLAASKNLPVAIVLAHISQECNTNTTATGCMGEILAIAKKAHIAVVESFKEKPSVVVSV
jgi:phosphoribosyl 1,2-cyclic phosphodiesterase